MDFIKFPMMFLGLSIALQIPADIKEHNPASSPQGIIKVRPPDQYANPIVIPSVPIGLPVLSDPSSKIKLPQKKRLKSHSLEELKGFGFNAFNLYLPSNMPGSYGSPAIDASDTSVHIIYTNTEQARLSFTQMLIPKKDECMEKMPELAEENAESSRGKTESKWGEIQWSRYNGRFFYFGIKRMFDTRLAHLLSQTGLM
ncbi:hypothetical protein PM3016_3726 [Paenibacillus mucilaginosus 3016]|uniref:Uncharacterized protein n=1 Tax=Paenibacillus mucilaginosus 3016 TaxID=1116391 RepID=H6NAR7_9BACL|nr:hypothetical protein [Paenibacillus mucilaginosus]AFC30543.1 hypothetical protein PM3016_3726 [Paenibacillus mucilaginosus 3016]